VQVQDENLWVTPLRKGGVIGAARRFGTSFYSHMAHADCASMNHSQRQGFWFNVRGRYLGFRFMIKGRVHYGWARLTMTYSRCSFSGTLTGYAYETIPNKAIVAGQTQGPEEITQSEPTTIPTPEPASLGLLSLGAPGLVAWRRRGTARSVFNTSLYSSRNRTE
jgi:hypothetical protein